MQPLLDFVHRHPRLFVLTGAGCSTESGIPDYRDAAGEWKRPAPMTLQAFMAEGTAGELARKRYWARSFIGWRTMGQARPGPAHEALARLEAAGRIGLLLTQNVDGLHGAAGSRRVVDLHGRIDTVRCMGCEARSPRAELQAALQERNPQWAALDAETAPDGDAYLEGRDFSAFEVPACPRCGGILKPDVVFFGESVPRERVAEAMAALQAADAMLVLGSSLMVFSGFRFAQAAAAAGTPLAAVNIGRTRADALLQFKIEEPVGATLAALVQDLGLDLAHGLPGDPAKEEKTWLKQPA